MHSPATVFQWVVPATPCSAIAHTQGWLHCDIPGTDASGAVKALMDDLHAEFIQEEMPNRVHLSTSCCEINCGGQADIAIIIQHTKPPKINHDLVANMCERPTVVARCPVAAIRPGHGQRQAVAGN
jgi:sulfite reductase beta subunit